MYIISVSTADYAQYHVSATNAPLASATAYKIESFRDLPKGWDYGIGGPIAESVIQSALE